MPSLIACGLAAAQLVAMDAVAIRPAPSDALAPLILVQADQMTPLPPAPRPRGSASDRPALQNLVVPQMLREPDLQQQIMDQQMLQDPQMQRLMQNPHLQRQMREDQKLRELYQLQRRALPGVGDDDDD